MDDNHPRKSKEQRSWELRKMQTAGIKIDQKEIGDAFNNSIDLTYKTSLFLNHKYYESKIENIVDTKSEMFRIGNKESIFFDRLRETVDKYTGNYYAINCQYNTPLENKYEKENKVEYKNLLVYKFKEDFLCFYKSNSIMVVTGETGCGKSTLVPKLIYDSFHHRIGITQPRRVSVKSLYGRMKEFYGSEIGYSIRFENCFDRETKIKFMTEGILLKEIQEDRSLNRYDVIILDEAHERSVNLDILIGFLKEIHSRRPSLKIIIMSATINVSKFTTFFNCKSFNFDGKRFPVDIKYLEVDVDDHLEWTVKKVINTIQSPDSTGDILVFLSGKNDIDKAFNLLCHFLQKHSLMIIKCYSEIINDVYPLIFSPDKKIRRVILSTNVSEASITIPNIKYVIDTGFNKLLIHDYSQGDVLIKCMISKESAIQRAGRCGRTAPGICYRMYTQQTFNEVFEAFTVPEILRSNLTTILLLLVNLGITDIHNLSLIDVPGKQLVESCYSFLILMNALKVDRTITPLGRTILNLGIDCIEGKMIYEGIKRGCSYEMTLLVCILNMEITHINDILYKVRNEQSESYRLIAQNNDFVTLINIFKDRKLIDKNLLAKCNTMFRRLSSRIKQKLESCSNVKTLEVSLLHSLFFNLSKECDRKYINMVSRLKFNLPKNTIVDEDVDYVTYFKTFKTKDKNYSYLCMKVNPQDVIRELGDIFENKKEIKYETKTKRKIIIDDTNLYDNFELEEMEEEDVKKIKKRRVLF